MLFSETCAENAICICSCIFCNFVVYHSYFVFEFAHRLVNPKMRNLSFYYVECKDTWDVPRDPAGAMCSGSKGHCPTITRVLVALFFLFYFPNCLF
jgi:hypothetical protein